jgi:hypothetical protein
VRTNTGTPNGGSSPPPAVRDRIVFPGALSAAEHAPAHQDRPGGIERFPDDVVVGISRPARQSVALAKARKSEHPLVELIPAVAQRLFYRPVRAGDETIQ